MSGLFDTCEGMLASGPRCCNTTYYKMNGFFFSFHSASGAERGGCTRCCLQTPYKLKGFVCSIRLLLEGFYATLSTSLPGCFVKKMSIRTLTFLDLTDPLFSNQKSLLKSSNYTPYHHIQDETSITQYFEPINKLQKN